MNTYLFIYDGKICELAANFPWLISVFDIYHINISAKMSVAEIAEDENIDTEILVNVILNAAVRGIPDYTMPATDIDHPLADIIKYIITHHHLYVCTELPRLIKSIQQIITYNKSALSGELPELIIFLQKFNQALNDHFDKEEKNVFPYITHDNVNIVNDGLRQAILLMEFEHDHVSSALNHISLITKNFQIPSDADARTKELIASLKTLTKTFVEHIDLEEKLVHELIFKAEN